MDVPVQGLTERSEQLNDLLPVVCHHHCVCLATWLLAGLAVTQGDGTVLSNPADLPASCDRSWALLLAPQGASPPQHPEVGSGICQGRLLPTNAWQVRRPLPPAPLPHWDSAFGAAYLCFQCAGQAKLCMFLVCELFQPCSVPAVVGDSAGSQARSHHRAGPC